MSQSVPTTPAVPKSQREAASRGKQLGAGVGRAADVSHSKDKKLPAVELHVNNSIYYYILGWPKSLFGFFIRCYRKTKTKFLANPITYIIE